MADNRPHLTEASLNLLQTRYLRKNDKGKVIETPREMFERVAQCVAFPEKQYGNEKQYKVWYSRILDSMLNLDLMPASPYLFNCRNPEEEKPGGLFSCFVLPIEDSIEGIYGCMGECALVYQKGGGVGIDFSPLRENGSLVVTSKGVATGPLSFIEVFNTSSKAVEQGGVRRGASIAFLDDNHPDIEKFITIKSQNLPEINRLMRLILNSTDPTLKKFSQMQLDKLQNLTQFNLSVKLTDAFMKAVENNADWDLVSKQNNKVIRKIKARKLFNTICDYAWKSGDPGVCFIDTVNKANKLPQLGRIEASNPCVPGDTLILTDTGYVEIQDITGFATNIWNGEEWSSVVPCYTGNRDVIRIEFSNGQELTCTKNHEFITINGRVKAEDLIIGNKLEKFDMPFVANGRDPDVDAYSHGFYCGDGTKNSNQSYIYAPKYDVINRLVGNVGRKLKDKDVRIWGHGIMPPKDHVPLHATGDYVIAWLSGLLDADGTVIRNPHSDSLQICSVNKQFLKDIQIMLTRVGVRATVDAGRAEKWMKDPKPQYGYYRSQVCYRLCINCVDTQCLLKHGLKCSRLFICEGDVQRDARRFVSVKTITDLQRKESVFCFYEHKSNRGTFNGIVTGQCGELYMHPYHACNLVAINLNNCMTKEGFKFHLMEQTVKTAVRIAENAIDVSAYPLSQVEQAVKETRGVGIGLMGFADILADLRLPYDSDSARGFLNEICGYLRKFAIEASEELAKERGVPKNWKGSIWEKEGKKVRNLWHTTLQPTGSVAIITGVSHSIEPYFNVFYRRRTYEGTIITELNERFKRDIENAGLDIDEIIVEIERTGSIQCIDQIPEEIKQTYRCATDISPEDHILMQAAAQEFVDAGISKTINMKTNATVVDVAKAYKLAHKSGCKGTTIFREGSKTGVLSVASAENKYNEELRKFLFTKYTREGLTARAISDILGVSEQVVFSKLKRLGIRKGEEHTAQKAGELPLDETLTDIILANVLVGHSKVNTVDHQSSFRLVADHLVYAQSVRAKFLEQGIQCSEIMTIVTDQTYYYFDTGFLKDIYNLPVDYDSVIDIKSKSGLKEFVTPYFLRHMFLVGGVKTGHGGIKFTSNSRNANVLVRFVEVFSEETGIQINVSDDGAYVPKASVEDFYTYLESGADIGIDSQQNAVCPECGSTLIINEKCKTCPACGYGACSI